MTLNKGVCQYFRYPYLAKIVQVLMLLVRNLVIVFTGGGRRVQLR